MSDVYCLWRLCVFVWVWAVLVVNKFRLYGDLGTSSVVLPWRTKRTPNALENIHIEVRGSPLTFSMRKICEHDKAFANNLIITIYINLIHLLLKYNIYVNFNESSFFGLHATKTKILNCSICQSVFFSPFENSQKALNVQWRRIICRGNHFNITHTLYVCWLSRPKS